MAAVLLPDPSPASAGGGPAFVDVPGPDRLSQRRLRATLRAVSCELGLPALRAGHASARGGDVLTVVAGRTDQRFVEATLAVADQFGLGIEIVAVVPSPRVRMAGSPPDLVDSMGAIALARRFRAVSGVLPDWDVLHGPRALARHVDRTHPQVVALAHHPHHGLRCVTLRTARDLTPAVLIA